MCNRSPLAITLYFRSWFGAFCHSNLFQHRTSSSWMLFVPSPNFLPLSRSWWVTPPVQCSEAIPPDNHHHHLPRHTHHQCHLHHLMILVCGLQLHNQVHVYMRPCICCPPRHPSHQQRPLHHDGSIRCSPSQIPAWSCELIVVSHPRGDCSCSRCTDKVFRFCSCSCIFLCGLYERIDTITKPLLPPKWTIHPRTPVHL